MDKTTIACRAVVYGLMLALFLYAIHYLKSALLVLEKVQDKL